MTTDEANICADIFVMGPWCNRWISSKEHEKLIRDVLGEAIETYPNLIRAIKPEDMGKLFTFFRGITFQLLLNVLAECFVFGFDEATSRSVRQASSESRALFREQLGEMNRN